MLQGFKFMHIKISFQLKSDFRKRKNWENKYISLHISQAIILPENAICFKFEGYLIALKHKMKVKAVVNICVKSVWFGVSSWWWIRGFSFLYNRPCHPCQCSGRQKATPPPPPSNPFSQGTANKTSVDAKTCLIHVTIIMWFHLLIRHKTLILAHFRASRLLHILLGFTIEHILVIFWTPL